MSWTRKNSWLLTGGMTLLACAASVGWLAGRARANGIPALNPLHYAGTLAEKGVPVDGPRDVTIVLWSDAQSMLPADQLCITQAGSTPVSAGRFEVPLDNSCTAKVTASPESWVEVQVGGVSFGRQKVGAVPYSVTSALSAEVDGIVRSTVVAPVTANDGALGRGTNDASIYNDPTQKSLVITGNNANGAHAVTINDSATVKSGLTVGASAGAGTLTVNGNASATGKFMVGVYVKSLAASDTIQCNGGDTVLSGGADCNQADELMWKSYPLNTSTWFARCQNHDQAFDSAPVTIWAVCMSHGT